MSINSSHINCRIDCRVYPHHKLLANLCLYSSPIKTPIQGSALSAARCEHNSGGLLFRQEMWEAKLFLLIPCSLPPPTRTRHGVSLGGLFPWQQWGLIEVVWVNSKLMLNWNCSQMDKLCKHPSWEAALWRLIYDISSLPLRSIHKVLKWKCSSSWSG